MNRSLQHVTILVADDMPMNLLIMSEVLRSSEAYVLTAANGKEVLKILEYVIIDVILMDLQMPEMDGFEATRMIRLSNRPYKNIPILAVTAETGFEEIRKCFAAGMNDYTTKPVVPAVLFEKLAALLPADIEASQATLPTHQTSAAFDLTYLRQVTLGKKDSLMLIVNNLRLNAPLLLQQAADFVRLERWRAVAENLHKLKGLTALFFMQSITKTLLETEAEAKTTNPSANALMIKIREVHVLIPGLIQQISKQILAS